MPKPDSAAPLNKLPALIQEITKNVPKFATWLAKSPASMHPLLCFFYFVAYA
jgi:hypothetical protein